MKARCLGMFFFGLCLLTCFQPVGNGSSSSGGQGVCGDCSASPTCGLLADCMRTLFTCLAGGLARLAGYVVTGVAVLLVTVMHWCFVLWFPHWKGRFGLSKWLTKTKRSRKRRPRFVLLAGRLYLRFLSAPKVYSAGVRIKMLTCSPSLRRRFRKRRGRCTGGRLHRGLRVAADLCTVVERGAKQGAVSWLSWRHMSWYTGSLCLKGSCVKALVGYMLPCLEVTVGVAVVAWFAFAAVLAWWKPVKVPYPRCPVGGGPPKEDVITEFLAWFEIDGVRVNVGPQHTQAIADDTRDIMLWLLGREPEMTKKPEMYAGPEFEEMMDSTHKFLEVNIPEQLQFAREFELRDVGRDGNCLFRAMSVFAIGNERIHRKMRLDVVDHVVKNWDLFKGNVFFAYDIKTPEAYRQYMARDGTYAGELEVGAAAEVYPIGITWWDGRLHIKAFPTFGPEHAHQHHLYFFGEHFQCLVSKSQPLPLPPRVLSRGVEEILQFRENVVGVTGGVASSSTAASQSWFLPEVKRLRPPHL